MTCNDCSFKLAEKQGRIFAHKQLIEFRERFAGHLHPGTNDSDSTSSMHGEPEIAIAGSGKEHARHRGVRAGQKRPSVPPASWAARLGFRGG